MSIFFYRTPLVAASFILKSLQGFINYFAVNYFVQFSLGAALQTNGVIESDVKEVIKKQLDNAPERKDNEKTKMTQIIGLMRPMLTQ